MDRRPPRCPARRGGEGSSARLPLAPPEPPQTRPPRHGPSRLLPFPLPASALFNLEPRRAALRPAGRRTAGSRLLTNTRVTCLPGCQRRLQGPGLGRENFRGPCNRPPFVLPAPPALLAASDPRDLVGDESRFLPQPTRTTLLTIRYRARGYEGAGQATSQLCDPEHRPLRGPGLSGHFCRMG